MPRALPWLAVAFAAAGIASCDEGSGAVGDVCTTPGFVCSTPSCYQFPHSPGCTFILPSNGRCPFDREHCSDPTVSSAYCDPKKGVCGTLRMTHPDPCPTFCTTADVSMCYDTITLPLCADQAECVAFADCSAGDGGVDMAQPPPDMAMPIDILVFD